MDLSRLMDDDALNLLACAFRKQMFELEPDMTHEDLLEATAVLVTDGYGPDPATCEIVEFWREVDFGELIESVSVLPAEA